MDLAVKATELLAQEDISARLLDMHTIKPIDREAVVRAIEETHRIVTVEDHNIINGLGSAVSEVVAEVGHGKVIRMGVMDRFGESGPYLELLKANGVTPEDIAQQARSLVLGA